MCREGWDVLLWVLQFIVLKLVYFILKINFFDIHFPCTASSRVFKLKSQFPTSYWKVKVKVLSLSGLSSSGPLYLKVPRSAEKYEGLPCPGRHCMLGSWWISFFYSTKVMCSPTKAKFSLINWKQRENWDPKIRICFFYIIFSQMLTMFWFFIFPVVFLYPLPSSWSLYQSVWNH